MSWFNARRCLGMMLMLAPLALAGCGFHPLHGQQAKNTSTVKEMAAVKLLPIADRSGQLLYNALLDRITPKGTQVKPRYTLNLVLSESKQGLGILKDETTSRANYIITTRFTLADNTGRALYSSSANSQASYNILDEHYASTASETNARDRAIIDVSDSIALQLSSYFSRELNAAGQKK